MIKFRVNDLRAIEILGTNLELEFLAEDLTDIVEGSGAWVAVTGDVADGRQQSTGEVNTVIFRTTEGPCSLVVGADGMVECRVPPHLLQRLLDAVQHAADGTKPLVCIQERDLEMRVTCTGQEAA